MSSSTTLDEQTHTIRYLAQYPGLFHVFLTAKIHGSDDLPSEDCDETRSSITTSDDSSSSLFIDAVDCDPLIPSSTQINQVYHNGKETWLQFLEQARKLPEGCYPPTTNNLSIIMKDVPALPEPLPTTKGVWGWAVWQLSSPPCSICDGEWGTKSSSTQQRLSLVRLLELQNRNIRYTQSFRLTASTTTATGPVINLRSASAKLVQWLSAILAPSMGWSVKGPLPPWAVHLDADVVLLSDHQTFYDPGETPPSASEAIELLIELCSLFGLAPAAHDGSELVPSTGAFLATLAIPFYRSSNFSPRLSFLHLNSPKPTTAKVDVNSIQQHFADLRIGTIAKVFLLRRPRVGLWWLGIFLLGDLTILDWIVRFLETAEERYGYGSTSKPDLVMATWSGATQSFLDRSEVRAYSETEDIPRHEVLWHRQNFQLSRVTTSWPPFGATKIKEVELELWPCLEKGSSRKYLHWVWLTNGSRDIQYGFCRDTERFVRDIPDQLGLIDSKREQYGGTPEMRVAPSKEATLRMLALAVEDATGDVHPSNACFGTIEGHRWLRHWRGLESQPALRIYEALDPYVEARFVRFATKDGGEEVKIQVSRWKEGYNNGRLCWWCISEDRSRYYWCNEIQGKDHKDNKASESE
ncbi:hypothetical protein F4818DRAFT_443180 [Hypoxylon cercidicola]|nr:hypothetical protein F4818DRAFT_443180 [Hypoxylon cercidicola]